MIGSLAMMPNFSNSSRNWPRPKPIYVISRSRFRFCSRYLRTNLPSRPRADRPLIRQLPVPRGQASEATTIQAEPAQAYPVARYVVPACACGQQGAESGRGGSFGDAAVIRPARVRGTFEVTINSNLLHRTAVSRTQWHGPSAQLHRRGLLWAALKLRPGGG